MPAMGNDWEAEIQELGRRIFERMEEEPHSILRKDWWSGKILEWCMRDPAFKVQMFRFVDVLPALGSSRQIGEHVREYFTQPGVELPAILQKSLGPIATNPLTAPLASMQIRKNVQDLAHRFIVADAPKKAVRRLRDVWMRGMSFTLDLLGEVAVSEKEALAYQQRYLELFDVIGPELAKWPASDARSEEDFPRFSISLKLSSLYSQMDPVDFDGSAAVTKERLAPIFRKAKENGAFLNIDMEHYAIKNLTLAIFKGLLEQEEFHEAPPAGIVVQVYLKDSMDDLRELIEWAKTQNRRITLRLVKGAYWDYEQVAAGLNGWPIPVFLDKRRTDAAFEEATRLCLGHYPLIRTAIASHNVRSIAHGIVCAQKMGLPPQAFQIQMLYGMAEPVKKVLVQLGYGVCEYTPIGELLPGMAYFVRRLLENTSNESFLVQSFAERVSADELLRKPEPIGAGPEPKGGEPSTHEAQITPFRQEPVFDFSKADHRDRFHDAVEAVEGRLGRLHPPVVDGEEVRTDRELASVNPARPSQIVGTTFLASRREAERALEAARRALPRWRDTGPEQRAQMLLRIAGILRSRRAEIAALQVFEVSKTWREADADVCEAIDFCEYYAREMLRLGPPRQTDPMPGESNIYSYQPRGVALVIAPWNFPLAISTGMSMAALVSGNSVIYKPSSLSFTVGAELARAVHEAGVPKEVFQYLPCSGGELGSWLLEHPGVDLIAFTGSREVGLDICRRASKVVSGQSRIKKVIAEMGGKNAIIVDADADLDEVVVGAVQSAFGFQGQKCSACSRLIALEPIYARLEERIVEATRSLRIGDPKDPATQVGAVIDERARDRVLEYIEIGKAEGRLLFQADAPGEGFFVGPAIFADIRPEHRLAQEEIFGPVLALMKVRDLSEALDVANATQYGLTGGFYSRSPANIERVKREFQIGNLYINRKITGAIVGRQPFGGLKLSGIGSKAGGPDYLLQFMEPKTVTENTLRKGFAPEIV